MFSNIGGKIKMLAKALCIIGIIYSVVCGANMLIAAVGATTVSYYSFGVAGVAGVLVIVLGSLASWLASLGLYGFGHLITTTEDSNRLLSIIASGKVDDKQ